MADVYEKNLDSKTNLTMNDFIRVVGSDNVSYKQLVSDVADKIITTYAGATLAGSEQSVKGALDGLDSAKQPKTLSQTIAGQTTVEGALDALNSDKQPKTMSQTIGGETTVEGCLSSLNSKFGMQIKEHVINNTSVSANNGVQGSFTADSISGYKAIAIAGFESNAWEVVFAKCILTPSSGTVYWSLRNTSSVTKTVNLTFKILYIPTSWTFTAS